MPSCRMGAKTLYSTTHPCYISAMIKGLAKFLKSVDRHLPAILFAFLLSIQGLVSSGAAESITFPELIGPDGRTLTFADLCNSAGEDKGHAKHCSSCTSHCFRGSAPVSIGTVPATTGYVAVSFTEQPQPSRPEATQALRRAPPRHS